MAISVTAIIGLVGVVADLVDKLSPVVKATIANFSDEDAASVKGALADLQSRVDAATTAAQSALRGG